MRLRKALRLAIDMKDHTIDSEITFITTLYSLIDLFLQEVATNSASAPATRCFNVMTRIALVLYSKTIETPPSPR